MKFKKYYIVEIRRGMDINALAKKIGKIKFEEWDKTKIENTQIFTSFLTIKELKELINEADHNNKMILLKKELKNFI